MILHVHTHTLGKREAQCNVVLALPCGRLSGTGAFLGSIRSPSPLRADSLSTRPPAPHSLPHSMASITGVLNQGLGKQQAREHQGAGPFQQSQI